MEENQNPPSSSSEEGLELEDSLETQPAMDDDAGQKSGRSAEGRINELLSKNKELEQKLERIEERMAPPPPPPAPPAPPAPLSPESQQAAKYLKELGFVQKSDLEERTRAVEDKMALDSEHQRLENMYDGEDGRPRYDRRKIQDYMARNGVYNPEVAYKSAHENELLDYALKQVESKTKRRPNVLRPSSTGGYSEEQEITLDRINDAIKTVSGRDWYEKNRKKILDLNAKGLIK